jgi:hypothetical protein
VNEHIYLSDLSGNMARTHWAALRDLLPAYQRITYVSVGNGRDTSFWHDTWLIEDSLAEKMPALFSHYSGHATSVHDVMGVDLRSLLQWRLSTQANAKLQQLDDLLRDVSLDNSPDQRTCFFQDGRGRLLSGLIYRASTRGDQPPLRSSSSGVILHRPG